MRETPGWAGGDAVAAVLPGDTAKTRTLNPGSGLHNTGVSCNPLTIPSHFPGSMYTFGNANGGAVEFTKAPRMNSWGFRRFNRSAVMGGCRHTVWGGDVLGWGGRYV